MMWPLGRNLQRLVRLYHELRRFVQHTTARSISPLIYCSYAPSGRASSGIAASTSPSAPSARLQIALQLNTNTFVLLELDKHRRRSDGGRDEVALRRLGRMRRDCRLGRDFVRRVIVLLQRRVSTILTNAVTGRQSAPGVLKLDGARGG